MPPTQPMRSALLRSPAPTLMPTKEVMDAPIPKTKGMRRNSMREPMP